MLRSFVSVAIIVCLITGCHAARPVGQQRVDSVQNENQRPNSSESKAAIDTESSSKPKGREDSDLSVGDVTLAVLAAPVMIVITPFWFVWWVANGCPD